MSVEAQPIVILLSSFQIHCVVSGVHVTNAVLLEGL